MSARILLVRHGETEWNARGLAQGHTDVDLNAIGEEQARKLGIRLASETIRLVFSSDLRRCLRTVELALPGRQVEVTAALRERSFGSLEGKPYDQIRDVRRRMPVDSVRCTTDWRAFGGESDEDLWDRLSPIVEALNRSEGATLIVTHGGTMAILLARLLGACPRVARSFRFGNAAISEVERYEDFWRLARYNDASHLLTP